MKTFKQLFLVLTFLSVSANKIIAQPQEAVTIKVFYEALSPYGQWIYDKTYGYVWAPTDRKFRPYYTSGYWVMTEHGSTWVSLYPWGWAPFHYGRWIYDSFYHWIWIPDIVWAPAWVLWRTSGDYCGWTLITPGTSISAAMGSSYYVPDDWWLFIPRKYFLTHEFQSRCEPARNNPDLLKKTSVNTSTHTASSYEESYLTGPQADQFARTGLNAPLYAVKKMQKPGKSTVGTNELSLYMPAIEKWEKGNEPKPAKYANAAFPIGKIAALGASASATQPKAGTSKKPGAKSKSKTTSAKKTTTQKK
jgi:hypothetical protein